MPKARVVTSAPEGAALLVLVPFDLPRADGGTWLLGEIIKVVPVETRFAWADFPQNTLGEFTVAQVNSRPTQNNQLYDTIRVSDSGTITTGSTPVDVQAGDSIAWCYGGYWFNYGPQVDRTLNRLHVIWEDVLADTAEAKLFAETYNIKVDMETIEGPDPDGLRRIQTDNLRISNSGEGAFTQEGWDDVVLEWNSRYPEAGLFIVSFAVDSVVVEGTFTTGQAVEFQNVVTSYGLSTMVYRKRWYSPPTQTQAIKDNGGWVSGPRADFTMRDRLLD